MIDSLSIILPVAGVVIAALITYAGTRSSAQIQHKGRPENALIDQLHKTMKDRDDFYKGQIAEIKATAQHANERACRAEEKATRNERVNISLLGYVHRLRNHIEMQFGPPAPEWPEDVADG